VEINRKTGESIQEVEKSIYLRTSISSTKFRQKMRMKVDMSDYVIEEILSMECEDKKWRPVVTIEDSN